MGKAAVSQASHKICKSDKQHVNSLLKALRPKVYITDCSSFKKLVQDLTGHGKDLTGHGSEPVTFTPPPKQEVLHYQVPVIDLEEYVEPESSPELSVDSTDSNNEMLSPLAAFTALQSSWMSMNHELPTYQELDSWPTEIEIDSFPIYDDYSFQSEDPIYEDYNYQSVEGICISDFDYSEIFNLL
ncbi:hypothetical protein IFM89_030365 [Coptis chinensis]|uniref:VQ domain-containing protein n=1 Tax=Coptis chinensis TaxID=261450 RepID=A0A835H3K7_9MAGN|nr:hypothetical protein IFM89_030365 [Coptis chinensis]